MIESKKLRHFVALAKAGNFNTAADNLCLSQPALTRSIQGLEQQLDITLFDRSHKAIKLTYAGEHLLRYAKSVMQDLENFSIEADRLNNLESGQLSVGAGPLTADHIGAKACAAFLSQHPKIQLSLMVDDPDNLAKKLIAGEIDVMIADPRGLTSTEDLIVTPLPKFPVVAVARANHPLANKANLTTDDIIKYPLATISKGASRLFLTALNLDPVRDAHLFNYQCNSVHLIISSLLDSDIISVLLTCNIEREIESKSLCILDLPTIHHKLFSDYCIITYKPRLISQTTNSFIDIIKMQIT